MDGTVDNACGAVARMVIRHGAEAKAALPLAEVLPALLGALPLRDDLSENLVRPLPIFRTSITTCYAYRV